jgi:hypothetical protein
MTDTIAPSRQSKEPYERPKLTVYGPSARLTATVGIKTTNSSDAGLGTSHAPTSDRNLKENFAPVDGQEILEKLAALDMSSWNYLEDGAGVRHLGPIAQDFAAAFGLGDTDRAIHTVDGMGVGLAAAQALYSICLAQAEQITALAAAVAELRETIAVRRGQEAGSLA